MENIGLTLGFNVALSYMMVYMTKLPVATWKIADPAFQAIVANGEITNKTQIGITFTDGTLTNIYLCNSNQCWDAFEEEKLNLFNLSLSQLPEHTLLRVFAANTLGNINGGPFKLFDVGVFNRDKCHGIVSLQFFPNISNFCFFFEQFPTFAQMDARNTVHALVSTIVNVSKDGRVLIAKYVSY